MKRPYFFETTKKNGLFQTTKKKWSFQVPGIYIVESVLRVRPISGIWLLQARSWSNTFDLVLDKGLLGPKASEDPCGMALGQLLAQYRRVLQPGEGLS